jgi:hypothetical protein
VLCWQQELLHAWKQAVVAIVVLVFDDNMESATPKCYHKVQKASKLIDVPQTVGYHPCGSMPVQASAYCTAA